MSPQKHGSSDGGNNVSSPVVGYVGTGGGRANGRVYHHQTTAVVVPAAKKPKMELVQADHELFLQAFESELLSLSSYNVVVWLVIFI